MEVTFNSDGLRLKGVLRSPDRTSGIVPGILLIHGSLEQDRDGNLLKTKDGRKIFRKNFFLQISRKLCHAGFATFAWDRRGFGESQGPPGDYFTEVKDARAALDVLCSQEDVDDNRVIVFGQSAGVYVASLLAAEEERPSAYILSGGLFSDYKDMMMFNYHRVRDYAMKSPINLKWAEENDPWGLVLGINLDRMFTAIENGEKEFRMDYKGDTWTFPVDKRIYASEMAPKNQFRHINKPTLVIHGVTDLNVPVGDAWEIEKELGIHGNREVETVIIPNADHSFQQAPHDEEIRLKERMSLSSFKRPYRKEYFGKMIDFLNRRLEYGIETS